MSVKKIKVHSGIFSIDRIKGSVSSTDIEHATKTIIENLGLNSMIHGYEVHAKEILESQGYPTTLQGLFSLFDENKSPPQEKELPPQIADIKTMLHRFALVREKVQENDAEWAAWNMGLAIHAAIRAQLRPIEPLIEREVGQMEARSRGGKTAKQLADERHKQWQHDANRIWKNMPSYSKRRVAGMLVEKYAENKDLLKGQQAISRIIKKTPLVSFYS